MFIILMCANHILLHSSAFLFAVLLFSLWTELFLNLL